MDHPLIKESAIIKRDYQLKIADLMKKTNLLTVLPTGTGKTTITLLYIADLLLESNTGLILFVAPTRPLVKQHYEYFRENLKINDDMAIITGESSPRSRKNLWTKKIVFSTPQVLYNDLIKGWIPIDSIRVIVFDEAHHAIGSHPYVKIMRYISASYIPHVIGLTASPGSTSKTMAIMNNLHLSDIYVLTKKDYELRAYLPPIKLLLVRSSPDKFFYHIYKLLINSIEKRLSILNQTLKNDLSLNLNYRIISFSKLNELREHIDNLYIEGKISHNDKKQCKNIINELIIIDRLLTYFESYGYRPFLEYYQDILNRAAYKRRLTEKNIINDKNVNEAYVLIKKILENNYSYPKIESLKRILATDNDGILIFVGLKSMAIYLKELIEKLGYTSDYLIGQSSKKRGMRQKEQIMVLERFRKQEINILIATHIGEEGLDISECKAVVFYDNPISAIRRIQRAGRTGRTLPGKIYFIINPGTRDESRYWAGVKKEKQLLSELKLLSDEPHHIKLDTYLNEKRREKPARYITTIKVDHREHADIIFNYLREKNIKIDLTELPIGDYLIGNILIERKKYDDLAASIIDGRIFKQLKELSAPKYSSLIILEGEKSAFMKRLGEPALNGIILTILMDFKIPIYYSRDELETAKLLYAIIKRFVEGKQPPPTRLERRPLSLKDIQKFVVAGLPDVDTVLADRLLRHFRTVENVFRASEEELMQVKGIGSKIARKIRKILTSDYLSTQNYKYD